MALSNIPSLSIALALNPSVYRLTEPQVPTLSIEARLVAPQPITVCSWHTILHPRQALQQNCFEIIDKSTNTIIPQVAKKAKRPAIQRKVGSVDEQLFITLMPQVPYTVQTPFGPLPSRMQEEQSTSNEELIYGVRGLKKGEYTLRVNSAEGSSCQIGWWRYGTKEQNLERACGSVELATECSLGPSEEPSPLLLEAAAIAPADFWVI